MSESVEPLSAGEAFFIVGWHAYEVNDKGRVWKPGDELRQGPLHHLRWKAHGRSQSEAYRAMLQEARRSSAATVMGVFGKALEIAGDNEAWHRGWLLDRNRVPLSPEGVANLCGFSLRHVRRSLAVLTAPRVLWIDIGVYTDEKGDSRIVPDWPGLARKIREPYIRQGKGNGNQDKSIQWKQGNGHGPDLKGEDSISDSIFDEALFAAKLPIEIGYTLGGIPDKQRGSDRTTILRLAEAVARATDRDGLAAWCYAQGTVCRSKAKPLPYFIEMFKAEAPKWGTAYLKGNT